MATVTMTNAKAATNSSTRTQENTDLSTPGHFAAPERQRESVPVEIIGFTKQLPSILKGREAAIFEANEVPTNMTATINGETTTVPFTPSTIMTITKAYNQQGIEAGYQIRLDTTSIVGGRGISIAQKAFEVDMQGRAHDGTLGLRTIEAGMTTIPNVRTSTLDAQSNANAAKDFMAKISAGKASDITTPR